MSDMITSIGLAGMLTNYETILTAGSIKQDKHGNPTQSVKIALGDRLLTVISNPSDISLHKVGDFVDWAVRLSMFLDKQNAGQGFLTSKMQDKLFVLPINTNFYY